MPSFVEKSYLAHTEHHQKQKHTDLKAYYHASIANRFRHDRMLACTKAYHQPGDRWLTIGDASALDAYYLKLHLKDVYTVATDISPGSLEQAKREGLTDDFGIENGEALSYEEGAFDWVLIKEALHHFPRPYAGLYEALRVAKKGVVLIEPNDPWITNDQYFDGASFGLMQQYLRKAWSMFKLSAKKALGRPIQLEFDYFYSYPGMTFEVVGNFLNTFSRRELEKTALAFGLTHIGVKTLSDVYIGPGDPLFTSDETELLERVQKRVGEQELLSEKGLFRPNILQFCFYKGTPTPSEIGQAKESGTSVLALPKNPYM